MSNWLKEEQERYFGPHRKHLPILQHPKNSGFFFVCFNWLREMLKAALKWQSLFVWKHHLMGTCPLLKLAPLPCQGLPSLFHCQHFWGALGNWFCWGKKICISSLDQLPAPVPCHGHKQLWQRGSSPKEVEMGEERRAEELCASSHSLADKLKKKSQWK